MKKIPHGSRFYDRKGLKRSIWEAILVTLAVIFSLHVLLILEGDSFEYTDLTGCRY
ncbi:MAG: hypothetical protein U5L72_12385 [Bacteroidales bacterium]|nr:hypothetical protein [Bacteroidales bacterium]